MLTTQHNISSKMLRRSYRNSYRGYRSVPGGLLRRYTNAVCMPESDIDWSIDVENIDRQLYSKYAICTDEIVFIQRMIKPM